MEQADLKQKQSSPSRGLSDQLQAQLHEQFATSDNEKGTRIVSFISAIAFVLSGYGFAAWYIDEKHKALFLMITIAACFVLTMLAWLCVNFGYCTRRDQFIIQQIRKNAMTDKEYKNIFHDQFDPKGKRFFSYLVSYYLILFCFLNLAIFGLYVASSHIASDCRYILYMIINFVVNMAYYSYMFYKYRRFSKNF